MTATALPARPQEEDETLLPVPWRRMAWVTWRQHRLGLTGVAAFVGAVATYLWLAGRTVHHAYATVSACQPLNSITCANLASGFATTYDHTAILVPALLQVVPALIGAFLGAPVLARELETGTFRYAWTQGFGRARWTLAKLLPLATVVAIATGTLGLLFVWYYRPFIADGQNGPLTAIVFDLRGIAFPAWTLAAFAIGALAGVVVRRVVPAIVATLVAYTGLAALTGAFLRQHYLSALVTNNLTPPPSAGVLSQWWTKGGAFAFHGRPPMDVLQRFCPPSATGPGKPAPGSLAGCLVRNGGYTQWTRYQPASHFWPFQWIEAGWLLGLSGLLIAFTVWSVRRRAI